MDLVLKKWNCQVEQTENYWHQRTTAEFELISQSYLFGPIHPMFSRKPSKFMGRPAVLPSTWYYTERLLLSAQFKYWKGLFVTEEWWFLGQGSRGTLNILWRESRRHTWHPIPVVPRCYPHCTLSIVMLLEGNCVTRMVHSFLEGLRRAHALWGHYYGDDHFPGIHDRP